MSNILLIGSYYGKSDDANGICVKNIAEAFVRKGNKVYVISDAKEDGQFETNDVLIYGVKEGWYTSYLRRYAHNHRHPLICKIVQLIRRVIVVPFYPNTSFLRSRKIYELADRIVNEYNINIVIGSYRPYEAIYASNRLKKKFGSEIHVINYYLDIISEPNTNNLLIKKYQRFRTRITEKKEIDLIDGMIVPDNSSKFYPVIEKVHYCGFPVYIGEGLEQYLATNFRKDEYNIAYIGTLDVNNRNPSYAIQFVDKIRYKTSMPIRLYVWGKMDQEILNTFEKFDWISYNGLIDSKYSYDVLRQADLLLNITNQNTYNMLPSKVIQLCASQRPILNFVKNRADCSLSYFNQYRYCMNIYEDREIEDQISGTFAFVQASKSMVIDFPTELVKKSTPEYFVEQVEKITNG